MNHVDKQIHEIHTKEADFIKNLLKTKNVNNLSRLTPANFDRYARLHTCTNACRFESLPEGYKFKIDSKIYIATGNVTICHSSYRIHLCGSEYCDRSNIVDGFRGLVCTLRGRDLGCAETLARNRTETDVFIIGRHSITPSFLSKKSEGVTEGHHLKQIALRQEALESGFEMNNEKFLSSQQDGDLPKAAESYVEELIYGGTSVFSETFEDVEEPVSSRNDIKIVPSFSKPPIDGIRKELVLLDDEYLQLCAMINNKRDIVDYLLRTYKHFTKEEIAAMIEIRINIQRIIEEIWRVYAPNQEFVTTSKMIAANAEKEYDKYMIKYYTECEKSRVLPEIFHLLKIYQLDVLPYYESIYCHADIVELSKQSMPYYMECITRLWEKYNTVEAIRKLDITFSDCCNSLLFSLKNGFILDIYFVGENPKPRIFGDLTNRQQQNLTRTNIISTQVVLIDPHPNLILMTPSNVRKKLNRKTTNGGISLTKKFSKIIPARTHLNSILENVIQYSKNLAELNEFSLSHLYPSKTIPHFIKRK